MIQCDAFQTYDDERGVGATYCFGDPGHEGEHRFERSDWEPPKPKKRPAPTNEYLHYPDATPWSRVEMFRMERDVLGCYVSGHPLDRYAGLPERLGAVPVSSVRDLPRGSPVKIAGNIEAYEEKLNVKSEDGIFSGRKIGYFLLLDRTGYVRCKLVHANIDEYAPIAGSGDTVIVAGELKVEGSDEEIETLVIVTKLSRMSRAAMENTSVLHIAPSRYRIEAVERFMKFLPEHATRLRERWLLLKKENKNLPRIPAADLVLSLPVHGRAKEVKLGIRVPVNETFFSETERIFGSDVTFRFDE